LSQEADRRILELNKVIDSLSVLVKEKEEQLSELRNEFGRKEKVMLYYYGQTFFMWNFPLPNRTSPLTHGSYYRSPLLCCVAVKLGGEINLMVCILSCQIKILQTFFLCLI
jgi:hypothetical protein